MADAKPGYSDFANSVVGGLRPTRPARVEGHSDPVSSTTAQGRPRSRIRSAGQCWMSMMYQPRQPDRPQDPRGEGTYPFRRNGRRNRRRPMAVAAASDVDGKGGAGATHQEDHYGYRSMIDTGTMGRILARPRPGWPADRGIGQCQPTAANKQYCLHWTQRHPHRACARSTKAALVSILGDTTSCRGRAAAGSHEQNGCGLPNTAP